MTVFKHDHDHGEVDPYPPTPLGTWLGAALVLVVLLAALRLLAVAVTQ
jgi:hypothetical protein